MRIFKEKNVDIKSYLAPIIKERLNAKIKSKHKSKSKIGKYIKKSFLEWMATVITPETIENLLPYGKTVLPLLMKNLKEGKMVRKNALCDTVDKSMEVKD